MTIKARTCCFYFYVFSVCHSLTIAILKVKINNGKVVGRLSVHDVKEYSTYVGSLHYSKSAVPCDWNNPIKCILCPIEVGSVANFYV